MAGSQLVDASAARVATGTGNTFSTQGAARAAITVVTTASSGTPSFVFSVEWSHDATNWTVADSADSMTAITGTANGQLTKSFTVKAPYARLRWTVTGGTPSLTFSTYAYLAEA